MSSSAVIGIEAYATYTMEILFLMVSTVFSQHALTLVDKASCFQVALNFFIDLMPGRLGGGPFGSIAAEWAEIPSKDHEAAGSWKMHVLVVGSGRQAYRDLGAYNAFSALPCLNCLFALLRYCSR